MNPYLDDGDVVLHLGDCVEVMAAMEPESVDAVVCDPPYGLEFMGKEWDRLWNDKPHGDDNQRPTDENGLSTGLSRWTIPRPSYVAGIRAQEWHQTWATEALRVLKPGGHLLAFGGSRTFHRLTCAIEDAGFEVRDCLSWLYGSGFPKSLDVSKAIDKRPGVGQHAEFACHLAERREAARLSRADVSKRVVGTRTGACWNWEHHQFPEAKWWPALRDLLGLDETWGVVVAEAERARLGDGPNASRRPRAGAGATIHMPEGDPITAPATPEAAAWQGWGTALKPAWEPIVVARKPLAGTVAANVLRHGTGALNVDGCRVEGVPHAGGAHGVSIYGTNGNYEPGPNAPGNPAGRWPANVVLDEEAAARLDEEVGERPSGARAAGEYGGIGSGAIYGEGGVTPLGGIEANVGGPSRFFYTAKASSAERDGATHPTVKPLALMRWLVRLVTPPGGLVLDPFAGSGTTGLACREEGFRCVLIEREPEYAAMAAHRLRQLSLFGGAA